MKITKETESKIIKDFDKLKLNDLSNKYNIGITSIYNVLKRNNIAKRKVHKNRKYTLNESYFERVDSEDKAYFLGLLYADGSLNTNNSTIRLMLQDRDKDILIKFNECIKSNRPIRYVINKGENWRNSYSLDISSIKIFVDIQKLGCIPNKTMKITFPTLDQVPKSLQNHFIRGYFDGDGCICTGKKINLWSIIGTINFLTEVQKILVDKCKLNYTKVSVKHPKSNDIICTLRYGGSNCCIRIKEYLYKNATIFLNRKKDKFYEIISKRR